MNRRDAAYLAGTIGLGALMAFGILTWLVSGRNSAPLWADDGFLTWSLGHRPDVTTAPAREVTDTGTGAVPYVLAAPDGIGGRLFATGWLGVCLYGVARWLPASFVPSPPPTSEDPTEDHAPQDPGRRGRSRPA